MRKFTSMLIVTMVAMIALVACSSDKGESGSTTGTDNVNFKVGMMIDSGTIDDKSFNQGTWEGILAYTKDHKGGNQRNNAPAHDIDKVFSMGRHNDGCTAAVDLV